jgi:hypothetical protein
MTLSPSAHTPPIPPVPDNAELVYVPPKAARHPSESRSKHHAPAPDNFSAEPNCNPEMTALMGDRDPRRPADVLPHNDHNVPEAKPTEVPIEIADRNSSPSLPVADPRRLSLTRQESDKISDTIVSPVISEAPSSAQDIDTVLDYYSLDEGSPEQTIQSFRPAFSPIREEFSSQLSPASAYRDSKRTPSTGRSYLGTMPSPFNASGMTTFSYSRIIVR